MDDGRWPWGEYVKQAVVVGVLNALLIGPCIEKKFSQKPIQQLPTSNYRTDFLYKDRFLITDLRDNRNYVVDLKEKSVSVPRGEKLESKILNYGR